MKRISAVAFLALALALPLFGRAATPATHWNADPVHSFANFSAIHLGIAKVTGVVPIVSGSIDIEGSGTIPSHAEAVLDPKSITTGNDMRDGDLRSPHFFDVAQFTAMSFVSTGFTPIDEKHFTMRGDLTMHGQTHPIVLTVEVIGRGTGMRNSQHIGYEAKATIDRTMWGMTYGYPVVSNAIDLTIDIDAVKAAP